LEERKKLSKQKHCNLVKEVINISGDTKKMTIQEISLFSGVVILKKTKIVSFEIKNILSCKQKKVI